MVIRDPTLRFPHSVAFTPRTDHLVVTNSGANYFGVYAPRAGRFTTRWSPAPILKHVVGPDELFREVNARNKMEGGPKGVAIHQDTLAVCSPEYGIKIYAYREHGRAPAQIPARPTAAITA